MQIFDWVVVAIYFMGLVAIVHWSSKQISSTSDYFLAGRHASWFVIGASLFASNIGSEHIVGLAGNGASSGMAMAHWELHAWVMLLLAWVFVPFYYRSGVFTMPEFLERRFDSRTRWVLSIVSLLAYVFTKVSVTVYAGALVFMSLLPDTFGTPENAFWVGAFVTVILTGVYTVFGGLRAVLYTEVAQTVVLLLGSFFITWFGLRELGGWGELQATASASKAEFALWRPLVQEGVPWWKNGDFPWLGILIASPVIGIWYWCTDQYIVQRTLASKDLTEARRGAIFGGFLKVWPVMIFLIPGMIGWALHQKGSISIPTRSSGEIDGDQVFATMVTGLLPIGLRGLVVAGLMSALMSSLASLFNSCATLFTIDIYEKLRPGKTEKHYVYIGRLATVAVVIAGLIWIPIMKAMAGGGIYKYLQGVQSYLAPPITAVFLLGLFWRRVNATGAFWGLIIGFVLGMGKLTVEAVTTSLEVQSGIWKDIADFNFLYYSGVLLLISVAIVVGLSLLTESPGEEKTNGITWGGLSPEDRLAIRNSWTATDVVASVAVLGMVIGVYLYFSFWLS
ncbi:sodium:solute symporter [Rhodopirellula sallentina]|uniref:Sodium/myo-inositol cotransporter 2 n=1 Tax=Rhodopirellula sallentina SM41 TaxID=1263870 RepID=M5UML5_9BACT|nr:sodium:solute symporter [Rhodopirellula sallentina]EMI57228.1 sodium/myo-inositol cotransporter 2 [Rhodopirellula sallentina SM41]